MQNNFTDFHPAQYFVPLATLLDVPQPHLDGSTRLHCCSTQSSSVNSPQESSHKSPRSCRPRGNPLLLSSIKAWALNNLDSRKPLEPLILKGPMFMLARQQECKLQFCHVCTHKKKQPEITHFTERPMKHSASNLTPPPPPKRIDISFLSIHTF